MNRIPRLALAATLVFAIPAVLATPAHAAPPINAKALVSITVDRLLPHGYAGTVTVSNISGATLDAWDVDFFLPVGTTVTRVSNAALAVSGTNVRLTQLAPVPQGTRVTVPFVTSGLGRPFACTVIRLTCTDALDVQVPTTPAGLQRAREGLSWSPSTDNFSLIGYEVWADGRQLGFVSGTTYPARPARVYAVRSVDWAGNPSPFAVLSRRDTAAPSAPGPIRVGERYVSMLFTWAPATDDVQVAGYEVRVNGAVAARTGEPFAIGPRWGGTGTWLIEVRAFDGAGNLGPAVTERVTVGTP